MALWDILKNLGNKQGSTNGTGGVLFQNLLGRNKQNAFDEYAQNMPALKLPDNTTPSNKIQLNDNIGIKSNTKINSPDLDSITGGAANTGTSVTGLQLSPDGMSISEVSVIPENKGKFKNFKLSDALLGKRAQSTDNIGTLDNDSISVGISSSPRIGGILNDLNAGMNENYNNKFDINNWQDNQLADGRKKGAAYRIGEGLGSLARGLATWGGDAFTAGTQGLDAAMKRQSYRTGDQLYRQQLKDNYGFTDEQLNKINGIITKDDFNTLANNAYRNQSLQVRQAIAGAKDLRTAQQMIFRAHNNGQLTDSEATALLQNAQFKFATENGKLKESNSSRNTAMNEELLPYKEYALQMAPQVALGNLGVAQGRLGLARDEFDYKKNNTGTSAPTKPQILTNPQVRANLVEYKKTKNSKDRQAMNEWFLKETGYTADYLLGEL